jgi:S-methylmethionine-dependent homocysteine/selenocysteine methylase
MILQNTLHARSPLILDGAMGTELQRRGIDTGLPLWSANVLLTKPDEVLRIHKDYITAGANIITTNTFRTTLRTMQRANLPDRSLQLTRTAVDLARRAREAFPGKSILIAGSIAPLEDCYRPDLVPSEAELKKEHSELAERLAEAGVDFILLETMNTIREAYAACSAAAATGKEVIASFVCSKEGTLLSGEPLADAVAAIAELRPAGFSINCVSPRYIKLSLSKLISHIAHSKSQCLIAAYGNIGLPESNVHGWEFTHDMNEDEYAVHAREWVRAGVSIVGGCCGTTPEYIRAVASVLGKL